MKNTLKNIAKNLYDVRGWRTNRKIIVIESDDWGSIRMPNKNIRDVLLKKYPKYFNSPYYHYDTIANEQDLNLLFDILNSVKDKNGRSAVLTADCIMANPDFERIQKNNFTQYFYEVFTTTLTRYYGDNIFKKWQEGIELGVFYPQLHGREHVDVTRWMKLLQEDNRVYKDVFDKGSFAVNYHLDSIKPNLTAALDSINEADAKQKANNIEEACQIFENIFGYQSKSFIAPSYTWDVYTEKALQKNNVKYLQGIRVQKVPYSSEEINFSYKKHYLGEKNALSQYYLIRNVFFERHIFNKSDKVEFKKILDRIYWLFTFKRPVIISSHRLNYIGAIQPEYRNKNLLFLKEILKEVVKRWPDVEFMTSDELGQAISNES